MTYRAALDFLFSLTNQGIKLGLENTRQFLKHVGADAPSAPIIHLAGTNGKGSTATMIHAILCKHGKRAGLFTSPHIRDFRERIRVREALITAEEIAEFTATHKDYILEHKLTFFEVNAVMAMAHFQRENCDIIILETGLGGRLDATNCFEPKLCILTPISMDHESYLGDTIEEIVAEKAGIVKSGAAVLCSDPSEANQKQLQRAASAEGAQWLNFSIDENKTIDLPLLGKHQQRNAQTALAAAKFMLQNDFNENLAKLALKTLNWRGRLERWQKNARVFLDVSHNPDGLQKTLATLKAEFPNERFTCLFAFLTDKRTESLVATLRGFAEDCVLFPLTHPRFEQSAYEPLLARGEIRAFGNAETPENLLAYCDKLLVIGSHFLLDEFHQRFG